MKLYTIGFTKTTAERFFRRIRDADLKTLIDTRLHRDGQLSGFAKMPDLEYFLTSLTGTTYRYAPDLAPSGEILKAFKNRKMGWPEYDERYRALLIERNAANAFTAAALDGACFLCSEEKPDRCHRRLAAEFFRDALRPHVEMEIIHL